MVKYDEVSKRRCSILHEEELDVVGVGCWLSVE